METPEREARSLPKVDFSRIRDFAETPDEQREFIELYLQETGRQLREMETALTAKQPAVVHRLAHTAAGASATCGMESMAPVFRELENRGKEGNLADAGELLRQAGEEFDKLRAFLQRHLQSIS
jgi:HPt (histidine-containing phosphotransfer) domain-containing protein